MTVSASAGSSSSSWIDAVLNGVAVASTVVATLRTASRIHYIRQHGSIGVLQGPLILPFNNNNNRPTSNNETTISSMDGNANDGRSSSRTNPLYELSEDFRHAVRLSHSPSLYDHVEYNVAVDDDDDDDDRSSGVDEDHHDNGANTIRQRRRSSYCPYKPQPYSLGATPYRPKTFIGRLTVSDETIGSATDDNDDEKDDDDDEDDQVLKRFLHKAFPQELESDYLLSSPRWSRWWNPFGRRKGTKLPASISSTTQTRGNDNDGAWDYGRATEGDYFYYDPLIVEQDDDVDDDGDSFRPPLPPQKLAQLTVYCPETFAHLRNDLYGIPEDKYLQSLLASGPFVSFQSNSKGAARVGGVFFFTRDGSYMIKTIKSEEAKTLLNILPKYHRHFQRYGKSSLLTRFCGMYGVRVYEEESKDGTAKSSSSSSSIANGKLYTFVVMNSVFPAEAGTFVSERFDLKGSTVGREVSDEELLRKGRDAVLKDLDLAREVELVRSMGGTGSDRIESGRRGLRNGISIVNNFKNSNKEYGLAIGPAAKAALLAQLREDVKLLVDCQVMDYSLLVGIVHMDGRQRRNKFTRQVLDKVRWSDRLLEQTQKDQRKPKKDSSALYALTTPFRLMLSPPLYLIRRTWSFTRLTLDSFITAPLPYYGSGQCGVDGGKLSVLHGKRRGDRAIYYMGLIDFLQPWTTRKVVERQLKAVVGYDVKAISSVSPEEYATRFLKFMDDNIS